MAASTRYLLEELPAQTRAFAGAASATGAAQAPTIEDRLARATGTAFNAGGGPGPTAGVASAAGTARQPLTLPVLPATIAGVTTMDAPVFLVLATPATVAGTATMDPPGIESQLIAVTVAGTTQIDAPFIQVLTSNRWTFYDSQLAVTYSFTLNPTDPTYEARKNLIYQNTLAPAAKSIIFDRGPRTTQISWSGTIWDEDQYNTFVTWFNKRYTIILTDDLGRSFTVYLTEFSPKRIRKASHPWYHTYDVKAELIS